MRYTYVVVPVRLTSKYVAAAATPIWTKFVQPDP
jgi:hypothetical protein